LASATRRVLSPGARVLAGATALILLAGAWILGGKHGPSRADREALRIAPRLDSPTVAERLISPVPRLPFFIGAWCGPPARATTGDRFREFVEAGLDVSVIPLEDGYLRSDNLRRLALLDTLLVPEEGVAGVMGGGRAVVRDDSVHWDESRRPGWEGRVARAVAAYRDHPSLAGYFLADEPLPEHLVHYAPVALALRAADPSHPVYVNFTGLGPRASAGEQARWRNHLVRAVRTAQLPFFTVSRYAFRKDGEDASFLITLRNAAAVSRHTAVPFGVVLQLTAHSILPPVTPAIARYQAMEAIAHGASGIVWFTYWTPDPKENWHWKDGMLTYDGDRTYQYETVRAVNVEARTLGQWLGGRPTQVAHFGEGLPPGAAREGGPEIKVPGLEEAVGGPLSIGFSKADPGLRRMVVINRDLERTRTFALQFDSTVTRVEMQESPRSYRPQEGIRLTLEPGGAAAIEVGYAPASARNRPAADKETQNAGPILTDRSRRGL
jgi:hypothetical protein